MNTINDNGYWAQLHIHLQDRLAGYVDGELDAEQRTVIEAHLAGCRACRADVKRQQLLHQRLRNQSQVSLSASQDGMLDRMIDGVSGTRPEHVSGVFAALRVFGHRIARVREPLVLASGWAVALLLAVAIVITGHVDHPGSGSIPMVNDVVAEYRNIELDIHHQGGGSDRITPPVSWPGSHVLTTWQTQVGGAPAQAYAVRSGRYLLFQYRVDEGVFYRNPRVRAALASEGRFDLRSDRLDVLALPVPGSGVLMVGPAGSLPAANQLQNPAAT